MTTRTETRHRRRPLGSRGAWIVSLALLAGGCEQPVPEAVEFVRPVKMLELVGAEGVAPLEYPAQISATTDAEIAFEVAGLITEFPVVQGQFVNTGDLLAQIDPRDYEAQLDAVRAERNVSLADYRRYQDLYAADAASLQELEVARRRFEVADAQIRSAEKAVADTTLRAPFSGRVARRLLEAFQSVSARQPVLVLQDVQDTLDVIVNVPENDVALSPERAREVVNQAGVVTVLTSFPDQRIPLRFKEFASAADPTTRTFEVTFSFDPPDDMAIMPGMTAKVYVPSASGDGFFVPSNAVVSDTGAPYVWVIDRSDMTVSRREIQVASLSGSEVQVVGGLRSGETVAVSAAQNLTEGMQVREIQY